MRTNWTLSKSSQVEEANRVRGKEERQLVRKEQTSLPITVNLMAALIVWLKRTSWVGDKCKEQELVVNVINIERWSQEEEKRGRERSEQERRVGEYASQVRARAKGHEEWGKVSIYKEQRRKQEKGDK